LNVKKEIENWKRKGIGSLSYDKNHFNNYPYFNQKGEELIRSTPLKSENATEHIEVKKDLIKKFKMQGKETPYLKPLKHWIYNPKISKNKPGELIFDEIFLDELFISKDIRKGILEGRNSIFEYILGKNPLSILNNVRFPRVLIKICEFVEKWKLNNENLTMNESIQDSIIESMKEKPKQRDITDLISEFSYLHQNEMKKNQEYKEFFSDVRDNISKYKRYSEIRDLFPIFESFGQPLVNPSLNTWKDKITKMRSSILYLFPFIKIWEEKSSDLDILKFVDFLLNESQLFEFETPAEPRDLILDLRTNYLIDNELIPYFKGQEYQILKDKSENLVISSIQHHLDQPVIIHPKNSFRKLIPNILNTIRENVHNYRKQNYQMKMFFKGILVPSDESIFKEYLNRKIKEYLMENQNEKFLTLKSRLLNVKFDVDS
jgi:hypothetical protein